MNRIDSNDIIYPIFNLCKRLNFDNCLHVNILSKFLGRISSFEMGALPGINSNILNNKLLDRYKSINLYCGIDLDINKIHNINKINLNIYQGPFYINKLIEYLWLFLPTNVYTESCFYYMNLEGRYRFTQKAINTISKIYDDSKIFKALFLLKQKLIINNFSIITNFYEYANCFTNIIDYSYNINDDISYLFNYASYSQKNDKRYFDFKYLWLNTFKIINSVFMKNMYNYYSSDPISKNSKILNLTYKYDNVK